MSFRGNKWSYRVLMMLTVIGAFDAVSTCGTRTNNMYWGSNNDFVISSDPADTNCGYDDPNDTLVCEDDVPLVITDDETIRRPASYRPTVGVCPASIANGQWWVHEMGYTI